MKRDYSRLLFLAIALMFAQHNGYIDLPIPSIFTPGPIPQSQFRVLFVEETSDRQNLPADQRKIFLSSKVREFLNTKCPVGPDGVAREWRIIDKDDDLEHAPPIWKEIWKASKPFPNVPCIVILNGTRGESFPLPPNEDETLALLKKYAGE